MVYEPELYKGIKKRCIPPPMVIDFHNLVTCEEVIEDAENVFFQNEESDLCKFSLARASGVPFEKITLMNYKIY